MKELEVSLKLPDLWQQEAIRALQQGQDVVVDAPTGSGKTYIFELLAEGGLRKNAVYTVPTRALANDKLLEWRRKGWHVGITTGDISESLDAPVVVATLETQKHKFLRGEGPGLLVIDEFQMLGDDSRGVNYELAVAMAPEDTQILMLSGSVGNPQSVVDWLRKLGRDAVLIRHKERPVPMEEVFAEALPNNIPSRVHGFWPRVVARALKAEMAPLLAFAPRRKAAEALARQLAGCLPEDDPLILTSEQKKVAGEELTRLLKARIAYHHSGLSYKQRAGLIEPLAKAGQLRVVVATMGLASGINFSMRSVLVTDREYRSGEQTHLVRPDELLQMFGRAGRRGLDKKGFVIVAPGKPRLAEARPLILKRTNQVDWPSLLGVMQAAVDQRQDPVEAAREVATRLFSVQRVPLGLVDLRASPVRPEKSEALPQNQTISEIWTTLGRWERRRAPRKVPLEKCLIWEDKAWMPALQAARVLTGIGVGSMCRIGEGDSFRYGRELPLAMLGSSPEDGELVLTKWLGRQLRKKGKRGPKRKGWTLNRLEREVLPRLPELTFGGHPIKMVERKGLFSVRLDYGPALVFANVDSAGAALLDPPMREREVESGMSFRQAMGVEVRRGVATPADAWYQLGLIDAQAHPTRRGRLFSFFNHGEGLAVAAALEEPSYPLDELVYDVANLRAGHRFGEHEESSGRLGAICRALYKGATYAGYLSKGVPTDYGDGASEILRELLHNPAKRPHLISDELSSGDIERARMEWRSLLNHIAHAPDLPWDRWLEFKEEAQAVLKHLPVNATFLDFPDLTSAQRQRHKSFLRFD